MKDFGSERVYYAPFDYVNPKAKIFIVGITPGEQQMENMLIEAQRLLKAGLPEKEILKQCKAVGSFSGPMRKNLVSMMDEIGIPEFLGIGSSEELFHSKTSLANLTSCIRYPTFEVKAGEEKNFNSTIRSNSELFKFAAPLTLEEVELAPDALILPLGPKPEAYLQKVLSGTKHIERLLPSIPHPSGANAERIAYFLGKKPKTDLSRKTNPEFLDNHKNELRRKLGGKAN